MGSEMCIRDRGEEGGLEYDEEFLEDLFESAEEEAAEMVRTEVELLKRLGWRGEGLISGTSLHYLHEDCGPCDSDEAPAKGAKVVSRKRVGGSTAAGGAPGEACSSLEPSSLVLKRETWREEWAKCSHAGETGVCVTCALPLSKVPLSKKLEGGDHLGGNGWCSFGEMCVCVCVRVRCLLYTSPSPRDLSTSRMPSSA